MFLMVMEATSREQCIRMEPFWFQPWVESIQRAMHIHPTVTELSPTMLGDLKPLE